MVHIPGEPRGRGDALRHPRPQGHPRRTQPSAEQEHPAPQVRLRLQTRQGLPGCGFHAQRWGQHLRGGAFMGRFLFSALLRTSGCRTNISRRLTWTEDWWALGKHLVRGACSFFGGPLSHFASVFPRLLLLCRRFPALSRVRTE